MKRWLLYGFTACALHACETPAGIFITKEFEANNRSSTIDMHSLGSGKIELLGYRQFTDSVFASSETDSVVNFGLFFPRQIIRKSVYSHVFILGTETATCLVRYDGIVESFKTEPAMFQPGKSQSLQQQETFRTTNALLRGTITYSNALCPFFYKDHEGWLVLHADSFKLKPIYQAEGKILQTLIGVQLLKNDTVYAAVHSLTGLSKKKAFLYSRATADEQLVMAAYIAVIARYL